ncbi:hypothetical protein [Hyalangium rubrum]|uniref:DUF4381 domain-containing protein n=1 Tax=Hyalangium rubrum TaxID=3103134 RepID=A0ABU5H3E1_9BACT|nr:hypothetical protein [Hyalangium sp. s54d21]MDY7227972.1 hypothetical protein [Hyalangium sp. s54d21]
MDPIVPLPEPLIEPLPIFSLGPPIAWWQLILAALLAWAISRWLRKQRPVPVQAAPVPASAPAVRPLMQATDFASKLLSLEGLFLDNGKYRDGCHELSSAVRTHLEKQVGQEIEALTAVEMDKAFQDPRIGRFATELRDAQYGREEPTRELFRRLCREARSLFGAGQRHALRGRLP